MQVIFQGVTFIVTKCTFDGLLLFRLLVKSHNKNHLSGGCWGRFLLRLSLSNIILRRGGVSPLPAAGQRLVLHKRRVRTRLRCEACDTVTLHSSPSTPVLSTASSHLESHWSLCSINHELVFWNLSEKSLRLWLWNVTLWSQQCVQHQPGVRAPGIWRGSSGSIPTSQTLQCVYSHFSIITIILSQWLKIILGEACLLFHSQQRQFLWPDQHLLWTLRCSPCSSGGRGQFRPLPDNPEHRQEEETEASWGWWSADGGGVEEYSDTFYKSHGENRAENVIMYPSWLDWVERNIKYVESPDVQI